MARVTLILAIFCGALGVACGGGSGEQSLRDTFESLRTALVSRDYGHAWDLMDAGSKQALEKQLTSYQNTQPGTPHRAVAEDGLTQFGLSVEAVKNMDARAYFIATLEGMDRMQPEMRGKQIEETRGREIVRIEIRGDKAVMNTKVPSGATEEFNWVLESGAWKCAVTSVGGGLKEK